MRQRREGWLPIWASLSAVLLIVAAAVLLPAYWIQPFRSQAPWEVQFAFWFKRLAPAITIAGLLLAVALVARAWRRHRTLARSLFGLAIVFLLACAWFARQNHFQWMFAPLPTPTFVHADEAGFLGPRDVVLAVRSGADAAAYPVRILAFHHLVMDSVGGLPVVVTY